MVIFLSYQNIFIIQNSYFQSHRSTYPNLHFSTNLISSTKSSSSFSIIFYLPGTVLNYLSSPYKAYHLYDQPLSKDVDVSSKHHNVFLDYALIISTQNLYQNMKYISIELLETLPYHFLSYHKVRTHPKLKKAAVLIIKYK